MEVSLKPQAAIINGLPLPSQCDIFVLIFWGRMGTPTEIDGKRYLSGTQYEFDEALNGNKLSSRPRLLAYRCTKKIFFDADDVDFDARVDQYNKVKDFFSNFNGSATGEALQGYNTYLAPDDFRKKLEYDLKTIINNIINKKDEIYKDSNNDTSIVKRISDKMLWSGSPFPGLRAFTQKDELIYFGRGREVDVLVDKVRNSKFTAIVGASGSGKSSLVGAGLFPRLEYTSNKKIWIFITVTPDYLGNGDPFSALAAIILRYFSELNSPKIVTLMQQDPKAFAFLLEQSIGSNGVNKNLIIFIDQFEELFTTVNIEYKNIFINLIDNILTYSSIKVVVTLRGDFYGECLDIPLLAKLLENSTFPLSAPSLISLHEMILIQL